jgi:hypothetical protein
VVADCFYGDNLEFTRSLEEAGLPYVVGVKKSTGIWAAEDAIHSPQEAVGELRWESPDKPGDWTPIVRSFRDGHTETWWAVDLVYGPYGPQWPRRMVVATTDPQTLPDLSTWYLTTNLPHPQHTDQADVPFAPADLTEVVRLYGLRQWVEQSYRQVKHELGWADFMVRADQAIRRHWHLEHELGWADFMVRADQAIRRHWHLVCCAFAFCWRQWFTTTANPVPTDTVGRGENQYFALLAPRDPSGPRLARSVERPPALLAGVVGSAPAPGTPGAPPLGRQRSSAQSLSP